MRANTGRQAACDGETVPTLYLDKVTCRNFFMMLPTGAQRTTPAGEFAELKSLVG